MRTAAPVAALIVFLCAACPAQPAPTLADVSYGSDPLQVFDYYAAPGGATRPLVDLDVASETLLLSATSFDFAIPHAMQQKRRGLTRAERERERKGIFPVLIR